MDKNVANQEEVVFILTFKVESLLPLKSSLLSADQLQKGKTVNRGILTK